MNSSLEIWNKEISHRDEKQIIADIIADYARDGDVIGVGSGSTSYLALLSLVTSGKTFKANPTSLEIEYLCHLHNIPTTNQDPDWCFDGADEVDQEGNMIKGRGGAMLREKQIMRSCKGTIFILIDESKKVETLGQKFAIPLEVEPAKLFDVEQTLKAKDYHDISLRLATQKDGPVITESGNVILDLKTDTCNEAELMEIDGIVETGLFMNFNPTLILPTTTLKRDT